MPNNDQFKSDQPWLRAGLRAIDDRTRTQQLFTQHDDRHTVRTAVMRRHRQRRGLQASTALVAAALIVGAAVWIPSTQRAQSVHIRTVAPRPKPASTGLDIPVIAHFEGQYAYNIAFDGTDIWLARNAVSASSVHVVVERRNASTAKLIRTVAVEQEAVLSIAYDHAGSVWVAGGGDGGVPETTVSRIDVKTNRVLFSTTLKRTACSCPIIASPDGAWLAGNGNLVVRLDHETGHPTNQFRTVADVRSSAISGNYLYLGLTNSRMTIFNIGANRVERTLDLKAPMQYPQGAASAPSFIAAIVPATFTQRLLPGDSVFAVRADGRVFDVGDAAQGFVSGEFPGKPFHRSLAGLTTRDGEFWATGGDQIVMSRYFSTDQPQLVATFNHDTLSSTPFRPLPGLIDGSLENSLSSPIATREALWMIDTTNTSVVVLRIPRREIIAEHPQAAPPANTGAGPTGTLRMYDASFGYRVVTDATRDQLDSTRDGGRTWHPAAVEYGQDRSQIVIADKKRAWALLAGRIWQTTDGVKWARASDAPSTPTDFNSMSFADDRNGWAANGDGVVFATSDGGAAWHTLATQPSAGLTRMCLGTRAHGWLISGRDLFRTENNGQTWHRQHALAISADAQLVCSGIHVAFEDRTAAMGQVTKEMLRSNDAGQTWTVLYSNDGDREHPNVAAGLPIVYPGNGAGSLSSFQNRGTLVIEDSYVRTVPYSSRLITQDPSGTFRVTPTFTMSNTAPFFDPRVDTSIDGSTWIAANSTTANNGHEGRTDLWVLPAGGREWIRRSSMTYAR